MLNFFHQYPQKDTHPPFPSKELSAIISKLNFNPVERIVVKGPKDEAANVKMTLLEPGKITSITNGEVFPFGGGFFMSDCTIFGTNVPSGMLDPNW